MVNFDEFLKENKEKINQIVGANTVKNQNGDVVITKDDPWRDEDIWDELYSDEE